jgi:uncharacterized membrane protein
VSGTRQNDGIFAAGWRIVRARRRLFIGLLCGLLALLMLPRDLKHTTRSILAWDTGVLVYLVLSGYLFATESVADMPANAEAQQEGEWTIFWLTVAAITFSFIAIIGEFAGTQGVPQPQRTLHVSLVALTLLVSWLMTHTTFAFRYAHEFYETDAQGKIQGGLIFPGEEKQPDYLDFLYFSLVIGMTFQVSDVQIASRQLRRLAAAQGMLSFLFNTIILALTVNIAAGLL